MLNACYSCTGFKFISSLITTIYKNVIAIYCGIAKYLASIEIGSNQRINSLRIIMLAQTINILDMGVSFETLLEIPE